MADPGLATFFDSLGLQTDDLTAVRDQLYDIGVEELKDLLGIPEVCGRNTSSALWPTMLQPPSCLGVSPQEVLRCCFAQSHINTRTRTQVKLRVFLRDFPVHVRGLLRKRLRSLQQCQEHALLDELGASLFDFQAPGEAVPTSCSATAGGGITLPVKSLGLGLAAVAQNDSSPAVLANTQAESASALCVPPLPGATECAAPPPPQQAPEPGAAPLQPGEDAISFACL